MAQTHKILLMPAGICFAEAIPVDTAEQIESARGRMRDAGVPRLRVHTWTPAGFGSVSVVDTGEEIAA